MNFTEGLAEIQGNVIGFNKPHQHFLLLAFRESADAREWLKTIAEDVTSGQDVLAFREGRAENNPWLNIAFTYAGLQNLTDPAPLDGMFPREFVEGMAKRTAILGDVGDNAPVKWTFPASGKEVHAIMIIAADDPDDLNPDLKSRELATRLEALALADIEVVASQRGDVIANGQGHGVDHFGFREGLSQPGFRGEDVPARLRKNVEDLVWPGEFVLGYRRQNAGATQDDATEDSAIAMPTPDWTENGSYLVVRRLEQNVESFEDFVKDKSKTAGLDRDLFKAKLLGRYPSGEPLAHRSPPGDGSDPGVSDEKKINTFTFGNDSDGALVPLGAHIRRLHPRGLTGKAQSFAQTKRILRRGIPYASGDDKGMLFLCYQRSIADQFEFLQQSWANDPYFPPHGKGNIRPGRDPFIGNSRAAGTGRKYNIPGAISQDGNPVDHVELMKWVTMTGGGYFFCPSKSALEKLARGEILTAVELDLAVAERQRKKAEEAMRLASLHAHAKRMQVNSTRRRAAAEAELAAVEAEFAAAEATPRPVGVLPTTEVTDRRRQVAQSELAAAKVDDEAARRLISAVEIARKRAENERSNRM
jgi:Dyp-type peroxidase family